MNKLLNSINEAQRVLSDTFSESENSKNTKIYKDVTKYLNLSTLKEAYAIESKSDKLFDDFLVLSKEVQKFRSSYIPISFFKDELNSINEQITQDLSKQESYENAFMRMIGVPTSDQIEYGEKIFYLNHNGELKKESYQFIEKNILDQRQQEKQKRSISFNGDVFNLSGEQICSEGENSVSLENLENDFYKFVYLLIPPIIDNRFSSCINEPSKIPIAPFESKVSNSRRTKKKPTLLESIIRIRLDKLSGIDILYSDESSVASVPEQGSYGVLESLFILRLTSAIKGLALKTLRDREELFEDFEKYNKKFNCEEMQNSAEPDIPQVTGGFSKTEKEMVLEQQKIIEDSILSLLGDNSEAIDLQYQTQRNSSIRDSHLMSGLLGIIDAPRRRINDEYKNILQSKNDIGSPEISKSREKISKTIGINLGIGSVDILAFSLALFTIPEKSLIGLLSNRSYQLMKNEGFISEFIEERNDYITSLNDLSEYIKLSYDEFINELKGVSSL